MPRTTRQDDAARLARVLDGLADGFFAVDGQGKICFMNKAARAMLATAGADPAERHLTAAGFAIPELAEKLRLAADRQEAVRFEAFSARLERWLEMVVYPAEDGLAAIFRDISDRKPAVDGLRAAFDANPHAMALLTWPEARFAEVNGAWLKSLGFSREEALGKTGVELGLWDAEQRDELRRLLVEEGGIREKDVPVRMKSGEYLTALLSVEFIELGGRKHLVATSLDISERRRTEERTREQLVLLEDCSDAAADATTLIVEEEGGIVRIFGDKSMLPGNPEGQNIHTVLPPPAAADLLAMLATVLAEGAARTTEFRVGVGELTKTVRVTAAPMTRRYRGRRTVSIRIRDITAEKAADETVR